MTNWPPLAWPIVVAKETLTPEFVRLVSLTLADALDLWRVQGINLRSTLRLLLLTHVPRQHQQLCERRFEPAITLDLAADVGDRLA